jgi:hypothetical protein
MMIPTNAVLEDIARRCDGSGFAQQSTPATLCAASDQAELIFSISQKKI